MQNNTDEDGNHLLDKKLQRELQDQITGLSSQVLATFPPIVIPTADSRGYFFDPNLLIDLSKPFGSLKVEISPIWGGKPVSEMDEQEKATYEKRQEEQAKQNMEGSEIGDKFAWIFDHLIIIPQARANGELTIGRVSDKYPKTISAKTAIRRLLKDVNKYTGEIQQIATRCPDKQMRTQLEEALTMCNAAKSIALSETMVTWEDALAEAKKGYGHAGH